MHHALQIQEILLNIFFHCYDDGAAITCDLASLARTCRAFKEPALDILWEVLYDLAPLARCLPDASYRVSWNKYSFSRSFTRTEWDILRSYTCRVRSLWHSRRGLDQHSCTVLSSPPTTEPLFPNLRHLYGECETQTMHLLRLPFPSLTSLSLRVESLQDTLESFSEFSPDIGTLSLSAVQPDAAFSESVSNCICRWKNLQVVYCPDITLNADALLHLSRMPALTTLRFTLSVALPYPGSRLFFFNLRELTLHSESLQAISQFLSCTNLPVITDFIITTNSRPSQQTLSTFWVGFETSITGRTIGGLSISQLASSATNAVRSESLPLYLGDLRPYMVFNNLRGLALNFEWNVDLKDRELLALASTWPHLQSLSINEYFGWNGAGITPDGLLQLSQKCRSLDQVALRMDARGYTEPPSSRFCASLMVSHFSINVIDSVLAPESVPALVAFFSRTQRSCVRIASWGVEPTMKPLDWKEHDLRWDKVRFWANYPDSLS